MNSIKLLTVALVISFSNIHSQFQWTQIGPDGGYYESIQFDGKGNIFISSGYELYKTSDSGELWNLVNIPYWNYDTRFINKYFVLNSGKIFVSIFGYAPKDSFFVSDVNGMNWVKSNVFPIHINSNGALWGTDINGKLYSSANDGETWKEFVSPAASIKAFYYLSNENYILYDKDGVIHSTFDSGKSYTQTKTTLPSYESSFYKDSKQNIYLVDYSKVLKSNDYGKSWQELTLPVKLPTYLRLTESIEGELLFCAKNEIYKSTDNGNTWSVKWNYSNSALDIAIKNNEMFCSINYDGIFKYNKTNNLWEKKNTGLLKYFSRIHYIGNTLFLSNFTYIYKSTDMGISWQNVAPTKLINSYVLHNSGFISYSLGSGKMVFSADKGVTWEESSLPSTSAANNLLLMDINYFFCFSPDTKTIYQSNDKGKNWYPVWYLGSLESSLRPFLAFKNQNEIYFSYGHKVYKSNNYGKDWLLYCQLESENTISRMAVSPFGHLYAICSNSIYDISIGRPQRLELPAIGGGELEIRFSKEGMMYIHSWEKLYQSNDFGKTFRLIIDSYPEKIYSAALIDNTLFAVTNYPGVLTTKVESSFVIEYPKSFLSDNYPNPFNASTAIGFYNKDLQKIELKIYDILGKEVETIIALELPQGFYKFTWRPKNISSGIYFCRIQTSSFTETKKMIYLK